MSKVKKFMYIFHVGSYDLKTCSLELQTDRQEDGQTDRRTDKQTANQKTVKLVKKTNGQKD